MFAFFDVVHFFFHELARLRGWRLAFPRIAARPLDGFFLWHGSRICMPSASVRIHAAAPAALDRIVRMAENQDSEALHMHAAIVRTVAMVFGFTLAFAQPPQKSPTFDVASVKSAGPLVPDGRGTVRMSPPSGGPGAKDPGRINYPSVTLKNILMKAYDVKNFQIVGPAWLDTERYDITATMPPDTTPEQFQAMLQNLLAERFKMTVHRETKELPVYSLTVAKNGPKLKESAQAGDALDGSEPLPGRPQIGPDGFPMLPGVAGRRGIIGMIVATPNGIPRARWLAQQQTMQDFANRLSTQFSRPVKDETGLKAKYDFTLTFAPEPMAAGPGGAILAGAPPPPPPAGAAPGAAPSAPPDNEPLPTIYAAIQAQLGLKLEPKKGPVDQIVVDRAEKVPTEN